VTRRECVRQCVRQCVRRGCQLLEMKAELEVVLDRLVGPRDVLVGVKQRPHVMTRRLSSCVCADVAGWVMLLQKVPYSVCVPVAFLLPLSLPLSLSPCLLLCLSHVLRRWCMWDEVPRGIGGHELPKPTDSVP